YCHPPAGPRPSPRSSRNRKRETADRCCTQTTQQRTDIVRDSSRTGAASGTPRVSNACFSVVGRVVNPRPIGNRPPSEACPSPSAPVEEGIHSLPMQVIEPALLALLYALLPLSAQQAKPSCDRGSASYISREELSA